MVFCHRQDLKKYFDSCNGDLDPETVKVREMFAGNHDLDLNTSALNIMIYIAYL